ncbi:MAG: hypothetical protein IT320_05375 [Anaerolineae bacterium]|nr:hypothetical protein [Anaerolineae bacterium]
MSSYIGLQLAIPHLDSLNVTRFTQAVTSSNANYDFDSWSGDNPVDWNVVGEAAPDYVVSQVAPDGSPGVGAALMHRAGGNALSIQQAMVNGAWYEFEAIRTYVNNLGSFFEIGSVQYYDDNHAKRLRRSDTTVARYYVYNGPGDIALDRLKVDRLALNAESIVSANGTFDFHFSLPTSPLPGHCARLWYRAQGDQNYWEMRVERNPAGTAWNVRVDSVSGAVATNRLGVVVTSTINAMRIIAVGDNHLCFTSEDGGGTWTQRGSTVNNSTHRLQMGVRALYSQDTTPIRLKAN